MGKTMNRSNEKIIGRFIRNEHYCQIQLYWKYLHAIDVVVRKIVGNSVGKLVSVVPTMRCTLSSILMQRDLHDLIVFTDLFNRCSLSVTVKVGLGQVWKRFEMLNVVLNTSVHVRTLMKNSYHISDEAFCTTFQYFLIPRAGTNTVLSAPVKRQTACSVLWSHNVKEPVTRADFISKWLVLKIRDSSSRSQVLSFL